MSFQTTCTLAAAVFGALCLTLLGFPGLIYWLFSLDGNALGDFLARRAGLLFVGLGMLCFLARRTAQPEVIRLVSASIAMSMGAMAVLGLVEFMQGGAGPGILIAVVAEITVTGLFLHHWRQAKAGR